MLLSGRPKKIRKNWNLMEHISFWSVLTMLICWIKTHIMKKTEALLEASREVGLEINAEKTKYMVVSHHQNAG
jgi:hypothetical protein